MFIFMTLNSTPSNYTNFYNQKSIINVFVVKKIECVPPYNLQSDIYTQKLSRNVKQQTINL